MDAHKTSARSPILLLSLALLLAGCKSAAPDDATLNSQVQSRLASDQNLGGQSIQASVVGGVVTLSGSVTSDTARTIASGDVAQVPGVKTVVDNLVVEPQPNVKAVPPQKPQKPTAMVAQKGPAPPAPIVRNAPTPQPAPQPMPAPAVAVAPPPPPSPPPAPVVHTITLSAGATIPVRITQTLDSASTQTGDKFTGEIASDIIEDGMVVLPQGTPVIGHVDAAQDAKHYKGSALLTISLTAINHKGEHISCATESYTKQGEGRGKNTAEKVGGGAAVGAILGGIIGGGKGAAIGAAAGGGVGAGANTVTRGQQVQIESETVVRFRLTDPIQLHVTTGGASSGNSGPALEHHTDQ
ncbi:MAG: BON domain-containing protein [Acidobacteriaceae bacterium]|jgi:outer membrane biosynthesis protein TonB